MDEPPLRHLQCGYCHINVDESKVEAHWNDCGEEMYHLNECGNCGKSSWKKKEFEGSGHILSEENDSLESMLFKVPRDKG